MPKLTAYPVGNADCCLIDLSGGEKIIFDYANTRKADDPNDLRIDLEAAIRDNLDAAGRTEIEVFCITHLDGDHICRSTELFWLEHAREYQSDDRIKIGELWVPAAVLCEEGLTGEARAWRQEARHRLKQGKGIRIFSRPEVLETWMKAEGLDYDALKPLFVDAGQLVPRFTLAEHGVEFFVHSPHASRLADGTLLDRNTDGIFVQATFSVAGVLTRVMMGADADYEVLTRIVEISEYHGNEARLEWDVLKLPHHCSYLSLGPDKGREMTEPVETVARLYEAYGQRGGVIISTSWPVPQTGDDVQPPHRQAANYYRRVLGFNGHRGDFKVTMEHPRVAGPKPLEIEIDSTKARIVTAVAAGSAGLVIAEAPRAG